MEKETNRAAGVAAPGAEDAEELSSTSTSVDNLTSPVSPDTGSTTPVIVPARENLQPQVEDEVQDEKEKEAGLDKEEDVVPTGKLPGIIQPQYPGVKTAESPRTTTFPQLSNNPLASPLSRPVNIGDDKDEESSVPKSFDRSAKRSPAIQHTTRKEIFENDEGVRRMYKFTLYETTMRYYIVGADLLDARFRILKIDRTADIGDLSIIEDEVVYTKEEMTRLLATIEDGNIINGGLKHRCPFWGLLGFIRFTGAYYMILVTKRNVVAMIGGHYVYQIDGTELVPLTTINTSKKAENNPEEARFVGILGNLDLTRSFYFSYSYDITHTLQHNISREREAIAKGLARPGTHEHNDMFAWNHYLLQPACLHVKNVFDWCLPIIHGYVDQASEFSNVGMRIRR